MGKARVILAALLLMWVGASAQPLIVNGGPHVIFTTDTFDYIHVLNGGRLTFVNGADVTLTSKDMMGRSIWVSGTGSMIRFGTRGNPIVPGQSVSLQLTDSSRFMVMGGGTFQAWGPDTSHVWPYSRLVGDVEDDDTTIVVSKHTGWQVGDEVAITTSTIGPWESELRTIARIRGDSLDLTEALWYDHDGTSDSIVLQRRDTAGVVEATKIVDARAYVANISRPIKIFTVGEADSTYGADIMVMANSHAEVRGVEFKRLGMATPSIVPYNGGPTTWSYSGKLQPGRYTLHWHFSGDTNGDYAFNCTTNRSRHKSFNVHGAAEVSLEYNVSWNGWSHQFVLGEDGTPIERDLVCNNNMAIYSRRVINTSEPQDIPPGNDNAFSNNQGTTSNNRIPGVSYQAETHPGAFMMWTPSVTMRDNIAAGGLGTVGFYWQSFMGRSVGEFTDDTLDLPPDFDFTDEMDSALVVVDTPTFVGNVAFGFWPEANGPYGFIGDAGQNAFNLGSSAYLSYRASGGAFWQSHGSAQMEKDRIPWLMRDFVFYNVGYGIWNEYENMIFQDVWGFHCRYGANLLGGQFNRVFLSDSNYTGRECRVQLPYLAATQEGAIAGTEDMYKGFTGPATMFKREYEGLGYPGIAVYNKDVSGGARPARRPITIHKTHTEDFNVGMRVCSNFEGPFYISKFYHDGPDERLDVDWNQSATGSMTNPGYWSWKGTFSSQTANRLTDTTRNAWGAWDGLLWDLDNNKSYWANGKTIDSCGGWVVLRAEDTKVRDDIVELNLNYDDPEPWYSTWSGLIPVPPYSTGTSNIVTNTLYNLTAIVPAGDSIDVPVGARNIRAYGCQDGDVVYVDGTAIGYNANNQPDLLNVNFLNEVKDTSIVAPTNPVVPRPYGQHPPKLRLQNPGRAKKLNISLSGSADSINPELFAVNVQGLWESDRVVPGLNFTDLNSLVDQIPIYGSRFGGTSSWASTPDFEDTLKGYGYRYNLPPTGDEVTSATQMTQDLLFDHNNYWLWSRVAADSIPRLNYNVGTVAPHPYVDSAVWGRALDSLTARGVGIKWIEPINEPYGSGERELTPYKRWQPWVNDTLIPMATARGMRVCMHLPPPDYFYLDTVDWNAGTALRASWADSARLAYNGQLVGFDTLKLDCAVAHPYREFIDNCTEKVDGRQLVDCSCLDEGFTFTSYYDQIKFRVEANAQLFSDGTDTAALVLNEHNRADQAEGLTHTWFDGAHLLDAYLAFMRINAEYGGIIERADYQIFAGSRPSNRGLFYTGLINLGIQDGRVAIKPNAGYYAMREAYGGVDTGAVYKPLSSYNFGSFTDSLVLGMINQGGEDRLIWINYGARDVSINARGRGTVWERYAESFTGNRFLDSEGQCLDMQPRGRLIKSVSSRLVIPAKSYGVLRNATISP